MNQNQRSTANKLTEGLRSGDLKDTISDTFTVDQYESKMGNDCDIIVLGFRAVDKEPAIDLMEFIEKGYPFVLDADKSSGEERDGSYSVFVELERNFQAVSQIKDLLSGISQLCDIKPWKFRWYKDAATYEFSEDTFLEKIPLTKEEYNQKMNITDQTEISEFFNQGAIDNITLENGTLTLHKPFAESLSVNLIAIGDYNILKNALRGGIQLDEASQSQTSYLNKYLGNYDINKIENHFLIRNQERAIIIYKNIW